MYRVRKLFLVLIQLRRDSAVMIQRCYRRFRMVSLIPRALRFRKNMAAITIQKYLKGFLTFHSWRLEVDKQKIKDTISYFDILRTKLLAKTQIVIKKNWLLHLEKKRMREIEQLKIREKEESARLRMLELQDSYRSGSGSGNKGTMKKKKSQMSKGLVSQATVSSNSLVRD